MDDYDRDPEIARLLARIRPGWTAARAESNLAAILERLKGPTRWRRAWQALLTASRLRYRTAEK